MIIEGLIIYLSGVLVGFTLGIVLGYLLHKLKVKRETGETK